MGDRSEAQAVTPEEHVQLRDRSIRAQRDRLQIALLALVCSGRLTRRQVVTALRLLPKNAKDVAEILGGPR